MPLLSDVNHSGHSGVQPHTNGHPAATTMLRFANLLRGLVCFPWTVSGFEGNFFL